MLNPKNFLRQCLLAVALLGSSLAAIAGPTYNVSLNTSGLGANGKVDFYLAAATSALPLTATVSNFSANFGAFDLATIGDVTFDASGSLILSNQATLAFAERAAALGGLLTFDVTFDGAFFDSVGTEGGLFSFGLYDENGSGSFANFDLNASLLPIAIDVTGFAGAVITLAAVNAVPEPSSMLMMITGLGLVGFTARRRKTLLTAA
ncbi:MAG: NF038129 family PEP-CTERM protein [Pseudomonadota bacterium]